MIQSTEADITDFYTSIVREWNNVILEPAHIRSQSLYEPKVSIVIPTYRQVDIVQLCIGSIRQTAGDVPYEIIIVDDGSPSDIQEALSSIAEGWATLINKADNTGYSSTINEGIAASKGAYVVTVNNDIRFHETGWLRRMVNTVETSPNIGIVGARLLFPDDKIQHGGALMGTNCLCEHRYRTMPADYEPAQAIEDVEAVTGALMLLRREMIDQIGSFSDEYFITLEDIDLCYRAKERGWRVVYCGEASAHHLEGYTRGNDFASKSPFLLEKEELSRKLFWNSWGDRNPSAHSAMEVVYVLEQTCESDGIQSVFEHVNRLQSAGYKVHLFTLGKQPKWFPLQVPVTTFANYRVMLDRLRMMRAIKVATGWSTLPAVLKSCDVSTGGKGFPYCFAQDVNENRSVDDPTIRHKVYKIFIAPADVLTVAEWTTQEIHARLFLSPQDISDEINLDLFGSNSFTDVDLEQYEISSMYHLNNAFSAYSGNFYR